MYIYIYQCGGFGLRPLVRDIAESLGLMYSMFVHDEYCCPPRHIPSNITHNLQHMPVNMEEEEVAGKEAYREEVLSEENHLSESLAPN